MWLISEKVWEVTCLNFNVRVPPSMRKTVRGWNVMKIEYSVFYPRKTSCLGSELMTRYFADAKHSGRGSDTRARRPLPSTPLALGASHSAGTRLAEVSKWPWGAMTQTFWNQTGDSHNTRPFWRAVQLFNLRAFGPVVLLCLCAKDRIK